MWRILVRKAIVQVDVVRKQRLSWQVVPRGPTLGTNQSETAREISPRPDNNQTFLFPSTLPNLFFLLSLLSSLVANKYILGQGLFISPSAISIQQVYMIYPDDPPKFYGPFVCISRWFVKIDYLWTYVCFFIFIFIHMNLVKKILKHHCFDLIKIQLFWFNHILLTYCWVHPYGEPLHQLIGFCYFIYDIF